jgi:hypothetical protein
MMMQNERMNKHFCLSRINPQGSDPPKNSCNANRPTISQDLFQVFRPLGEIIVVNDYMMHAISIESSCVFMCCNQTTFLAKLLNFY